MNYMNDSREFQDTESSCSGKLSHVPRQTAVVPSPRSMLSRDQSLRSDTWSLSGHRDTFLAIHEQSSIHHRHLIKGFFTLGIKVIQVESSCRGVQGHLPRKAKNKLEAQFQCGCLNSFLPAEIPQNFMAVQQKTANIGASF